jgi:hypothetical protein
MEPRDVPGANFRYSKITQEDFLGCGIVELPPNGLKRPKNSRRMHMVFFVATGTVEVTVHQSSFTIHHGGVFQVPRGESLFSSTSCNFFGSFFSFLVLLFKNFSFPHDCISCCTQKPPASWHRGDHGSQQLSADIYFFCRLGRLASLQSLYDGGCFMLIP